MGVKNILAAKLKGVVVFIMLFVMTIVLNGCQENLPAAHLDEVKYVIGISQANLIEPWRVRMNEELGEEVVKHPEMRAVFTDAAQSSQKQIYDVEELLKSGVDLLIISPNDATDLTPIVTQVYKQIPVIVLDRGVEGYEYTLYIGPDNKAIGHEAGKYIAELLGETGGNVVEIEGPAELPSVRERNAGFREAIERQPNIKIVDTIIADWQRDEAEDKMAELLDKNRNVDVVFAQSDYMALGAYKAAQKRGLKQIKFIGIDGFDGSSGGVQLVEQGILQGTFTCQTGGREAIQYAVDILNHEHGLPKKIIPRSNKITADNVQSYLQMKNEGTNEKGKKGDIVLGFSQLGAESDWRLANSESIKKAAQAEGIKLLFVEADQQQEKQIQTIRSFIDLKVDMIAFSPVVETGWDEVLEEAKTAGIPVILCDRAVKPDDNTLYATFIGSDFLEEGRRAARWLIGKKQGQLLMNIVELEGTSGSAPAIDRKQGFAETIADHPEMRIIYSASGDFTQVQGKKIMKEALNVYGDQIDVVYAHNDDMALGAIEAIEEKGLRPGKDILIVSVDATKAAFRAMLADKLNCTIECTPLLGPQLVQAVKNLLSGRELPGRIITSEGVFPAETARSEYVNRKY
jgi:galactofuranose transport system substrate-binding protein